MRFYAAYDETLSSRERALVAAAHTFCQGEFSAHLLDAHNQGRAFDPVWITRWADAGFLGLQTPRALGGHDASFLCKIRIAQTMAEHGFAAAFALNNLQGAVTRVARAGTDAHRAEWLAGMLNGRVPCAFALSEPDGGSDLSALKTTAQRIDGGWRINGVKSWITNGQILQCANVLARVIASQDETDADDIGRNTNDSSAPNQRNAENVASFLIPLHDGPTLKREDVHMPGAWAFRLAHLRFQDYRVPHGCLLHAPGHAFKLSMDAVNAARVHVAAMCVASAHAALVEAVRYGATRRAFGQPLLKHQGLAWELAEVALRLEAANALVLRAAVAVQTNTPAMTLAAQAKKFAVDLAVWGIEQCLRAMGATGASAHHRLVMLANETRLAAFADGTNEMLLNRIATALTTEYGGIAVQHTLPEAAEARTMATDTDLSRKMGDL